MPNEIRAGAAHVQAAVLDETDRRILALLEADARATNKAVADAVGIAPSTCHTRIRSLQERGVIQGFRTEVDPAAMGRSLQALIAIRLHSHARSGLTAFRDYLAGLPNVEGIYFVTGTVTSWCTSRCATRRRCGTWSRAR
ncbi:Lrp/AsnC family transcriptional regulator [Oerskovia sp. M15]